MSSSISPDAGFALVPDVVVLPLVGRNSGAAALDPSFAPAIDAPHDVAAPLATETINALHLVNGEHYSGAERVQDLLARQLPRFGCEVGFACVKP